MCFSRSPAVFCLSSGIKLLEYQWSEQTIGSFGKKSNNVDFLDCIKNGDIDILSELWGYEIDGIPNFEIRQLSPPKKSHYAKSGRFSGGIFIAVKKLITQYISVVQKISDYIWTGANLKNLSSKRIKIFYYAPVTYHQKIPLMTILTKRTILDLSG